MGFRDKGKLQGGYLGDLDKGAWRRARICSCEGLSKAKEGDKRCSFCSLDKKEQRMGNDDDCIRARESMGEEQAWLRPGRS